MPRTAVFSQERSQEPTLVLPILVLALSLDEAPDRLVFDSLKDFLRGRQRLLVLDNFEHVTRRRRR